jgi:hypothetical protein
VFVHFLPFLLVWNKLQNLRGAEKFPVTEFYYFVWTDFDLFQNETVNLWNASTEIKMQRYGKFGFVISLKAQTCQISGGS